MRERAPGILVPFAAFGLLAFAVGFLGSGIPARLGILCAILAYLAHVNLWLWARCRPWPLVQGFFRTPLAPAGTGSSRELQIEYTFAGETFLRPAQTQGAVGHPVAIRVNPADPSFSSLDSPAPRAWIVLYALAVTLLVITLVRSVAAA